MFIEIYQLKWWALRMMLKTVLIEPWIKILDQALNIVLTPTQFSPGVLLILQERYNVL